MKKIFILPILIAPIMAHATNPVGPSAVGQGEIPVIATANAPYATAGAETGDTTQVVSASYVKGAYNDAIAAVNKVNSDKQDKLVKLETGNGLSSAQVLGFDVIDDLTRSYRDGNSDMLEGNYLNQIVSDPILKVENSLVTAGGVLAGLKNVAKLVEDTEADIEIIIEEKRVNALATWGSNNVTQLELQNRE